MLEPVPFERMGRATLADPVGASPFVWWQAAVQDPSGRVGLAAIIAASSLHTIG